MTDSTYNPNVRYFPEGDYTVEEIVVTCADGTEFHWSERNEEHAHDNGDYLMFDDFSIIEPEESES